MSDGDTDLTSRFRKSLVVVTGGGSGMGKASVQRFVAEGAFVLAVDLTGDAGTYAAEFGGAAELVRADVTSQDDWMTVADRVKARGGRLSVLVNCAGLFLTGSLETEDTNTLQRTFEVNQRGPLLGTQSMLPFLRATEGSAVVNVASGAGLFGMTGALGYTASKWALRGISRSLARELAPNIRVNCVFPGLIDTPMMANNSDEVNAAFVANTPLRRTGRPTEIASIIAFLASYEASYLTGCEIAADGGLTA